MEGEDPTQGAAEAPARPFFAILRNPMTPHSIPVSYRGSGGPLAETWLARPDVVEWADTDRLRRSWDPNRDPKLPETGRI